MWAGSIPGGGDGGRYRAAPVPQHDDHDTNHDARQPDHHADNDTHQLVVVGNGRLAHCRREETLTLGERGGRKEVWRLKPILV